MGLGGVDDTSDWFVWTHDKHNITKGIVSGALPENGPGFWELYREDLQRARKELCNNAIRLSMDWSRIFPSPTRSIPGKVFHDKRGNIAGVDIPPDSMDALEAHANQESVQKYRQILTEVRNLGLEIVLTVYHWPLPIWLHDPITCRDHIQTTTRTGWLNQQWLNSRSTRDLLERPSEI